MSGEPGNTVALLQRGQAGRSARGTPGDVRVTVQPSPPTLMPGKAPIEADSQVIVPDVDSVRTHRRIPSAARFARSRRKRAFDVAVAATALLVSAPVLLGAAAAIRSTSAGPILHRQRRVGLGGKSFTLIKFRTMYAGSDEAPHRSYVTSLITAPETATPINGVYKLSRDPRVTPVGRWLRKLSIDELPQLLNVLRDEMTIVGPRPPLAYEVDVYETWQLERLTVRPGITGAWQVGGRNRVSYAEMCRMDIAYIRDWTMGRDLGIVLRTPLALINVRGTA